MIVMKVQSVKKNSRKFRKVNSPDNLSYFFYYYYYYFIGNSK